MTAIFDWFYGLEITDAVSDLGWLTGYGMYETVGTVVIAAEYDPERLTEVVAFGQARVVASLIDLLDEAASFARKVMNWYRR